MINANITNANLLTASLEAPTALSGTVGGGVITNLDHTKLQNRDSANQHTIGSITDLQEALDNKSNITHTHETTDINGLSDTISSLQDDIDSKQPAGNYALKSELPTKISDLNDDIAIVNELELVDAMATKANLVHVHEMTDILDLINSLNGLQTAIDGKQPSGNYALATDIPTKVSELDNDSGYLTLTDLPIYDGEVDDSGS